MGHQSRLKRARREERVQVREHASRAGEPLRILRAIHKTIQGHCGENSRRCWEYLLEMTAHSSGWQTDTNEAEHLWEKMYDEPRWLEFMQSWHSEVDWAHKNHTSFSEPFGELLEDLEGTNDHLGQFFTPMAVVRMMNELTLDHEPPHSDGMPTCRGIDPACGTGRFMIDALVHNEGLLMHGIDTDLWMVRCAMLNVRLLAKWTSLRIRGPVDLLAPLRGRNMFDRMLAQAKPVTNHVMLRQLPEDLDEDAKRSGDTIMIGGRSIFMNADALIVDTEYIPNWTCAGWHWKPHPWRNNLKIAGYMGTYNEWEAAGRPRLGAPSTEIQFDYSMRQSA
jgi:hypothetical protein